MTTFIQKFIIFFSFILLSSNISMAKEFNMN